MIAYLYPNKGFDDPITYNDRKVDAGEAVLILTEGLVAEGRNTAERIGIMESLLPDDGVIPHPATHIAVSPHPGDRLTQDGYRTVAERFIEYAGYAGRSVLAYVHADILRDHMHIVTSAYDDSGRYVRSSRERSFIHKVASRIESEMGLCPLRVDIGAIGALPQSVFLPRAWPDMGYVSIQTAVTLATLTSRFCFHDLDEFNALLNVYGMRLLVCQRRNGREGLIYRMTAKEHPRRIKASEFDRRFDKPTIEAMMAARRPDEAATRRMRDAVTEAADVCGTDFGRFCDTLAAKGIDVLPSREGYGRIRTLVFLDRSRRETFSLPSLGCGSTDLLRFGDEMRQHAYTEAPDFGPEPWRMILRSVLQAQGIPMSRYLEREVTMTDIVEMDAERRRSFSDSSRLAMKASDSETRK